jgi:hypothetical protein
MITLFKRRPRLFWRPKEGAQIVPPDVQNQYPELQSDFGVLEKQLLDDFRRLDNKALEAQNQFRLLQIILIAGAVATSTLGAIHAALPDAPWPGITEAIVAALLTATAFAAKQLDSQKKYFSNRLKAEMLRGEYFLFLSRVGAYNDDSARVQNLIRRVAEIQAEQKGA